MAKDITDKDTRDAFITFEQLERETFIGNALATGGHYQAVRPDKFYQAHLAESSLLVSRSVYSQGH